MSRRPVQRSTGRPKCFFLSALLVVAVAAAACTSAPDAAVENGPGVAREVPGVDFDEIDETVQIGVLVDRSGAFAAQDEALLATVQAAVGATNRVGGIDEVPLALAVADSAGDVDASLDAFRRMRNLGVEVVLTGCDVSIARAIAARTDDGDFLFVDMCPSAAPVDGAARTAVALGLAPRAIGAGMAHVAIASQWRSVVVLADVGDAGLVEQCEGFAETFVAEGRAIDARYDVGAGDSVDALLDDLTDGDRPDGVVLCMRHERAVEAVPELRAATAATVLAGPSQLPWMTGDAPASIAVVAPYVSASNDVAGIAGTVAVQLVVDAHAGRPETGAATLFAALRIGDRDTALGLIDIDGEGRRVDGSMALYAIGPDGAPGAAQSWGSQDPASAPAIPVASPGTSTDDEP